MSRAAHNKMFTIILPYDFNNYIFNNMLLYVLISHFILIIWFTICAILVSFYLFIINFYLKNNIVTIAIRLNYHLYH